VLAVEHTNLQAGRKLMIRSAMMLKSLAYLRGGFNERYFHTVYDEDGLYVS
jgi:hypothetical protein